MSMPMFTAEEGFAAEDLPPMSPPLYDPSMMSVDISSPVIPNYSPPQYGIVMLLEDFVVDYQQDSTDMTPTSYMSDAEWEAELARYLSPLITDDMDVDIE